MMKKSEDWSKEELEAKIYRLEEGELSEEDQITLREILKEDHEARMLYLDIMEMSYLLSHVPTKEDIIPFAPAKAESNKRATAMLAAAAIALLLGLAFLLNRPEKEFLVKISPSADAEYLSKIINAQPGQKAGLRVGDALELKKGSLTLTYPSGVTAQIEGETTAEVTSTAGLNLTGGNSWFTVPKGAEGFAATSKGIEIIDLGTEFGMNFLSKDLMEVSVGLGSVRAEPENKDPIVLNEGDVMSFDLSGLSSPYLYWSFDELEGESFPAVGGLETTENPAFTLKQAQGKKVNPSSHLTTGKIGQAFSLDGSGVYAESLFTGIAGNKPRTVCMWIKHRKTQITRNINNPYLQWGSHGENTLWRITVTKNKEVNYLTTLTFDEVIYGELNENFQDEWTHLTVLYNGDLAESEADLFHYFINGKPLENRIAGRQKYKVLNTSTTQPMRIGLHSFDNQKEPTLDGDIDELYIFDGALSEEEIRQVYLKE